MKFHDYRTQYEIERRPGESLYDFLKERYSLIRRMLKGDAEQRQIADALGRLTIGENYWSLDCRPYYSMYPVAEKMLRSMKLDVPMRTISPPLSNLLIRFAVGHEPQNSAGNSLRTIFMCGDHPESKEYTNAASPLYVFCCTDQHDDEIMGGKRGMAFDLSTDTTVEETLATIYEKAKEQNFKDYDNNDVFNIAMRYVMGLSLLGHDSEIVEPDVLDKDRARWQESHDPKYIDKAHRRGKKGWTIGAHLETTPHMRRPHFGIRWTEKGRSVPKLVPISGSLVMRKKIGEVPTGYLGMIDNQGDSDG